MDDMRNRYRRDFTTEPARRPYSPAKRLTAPAHEPAHMPEPAKPVDLAERKRQKKLTRGRKKPLLIFFLLILVATAALGVYWYKFLNISSPVPKTVTASTSYPVLYPSKLPPGYSIKTSSFTTSQQAIIYEADNSSGGRIVFSVEARPANLNFPAFYQRGMNGAKPFSTPAGQAALGTANGVLLGSLVSDKSWALINSPSGGLLPDDFRYILQNIKSPTRYNIY